MNETQNKSFNIDLIEIFILLWSSKILIIFLTSIFAVSTVFYTLSLQNLYKSETIAAIFSESGSSLQSQYGGIAAIAGISLPSSSGLDKGALIQKTITSRDFVQHLISIDEDFLPNLMAIKEYKKSSKVIILDEEIYRSSDKTWVRPPVNGNVIPSFLEAHRAYLNVISFSQEKISRVISISVEHQSPEFAHNLLLLMLKELNNVIKNNDLKEAESSIEYLNNQLNQISQADLRKSVNTLIEAQLKKLMLTNVKEYYILQPLDLPFIPEEKSNPPRALICIIGTIFGFILTISFVLIRHYFFNISKNSV